MLTSLDIVQEDMLPIFNSAAKRLLDQYKGDSIAALSKTLAYISGHHTQDSKSKSDYNSNAHCDPDHDADGDGGYGGNRGGSRSFGGGSGGGRGRGAGRGRGGSSNNGGGGGGWGQNKYSMGVADEPHSVWSRPPMSGGRGQRGPPPAGMSSGGTSHYSTPGSRDSKRPYYNAEFSGGNQGKYGSGRGDYPVY